MQRVILAPRICLEKHSHRCRSRPHNEGIMLIGRQGLQNARVDRSTSLVDTAASPTLQIRSSKSVQDGTLFSPHRGALYLH